MIVRLDRLTTRGLGKRRGKQNRNYGKLYNAPADIGKQRVVDGKRTSGGGAPTPLKFYRCENVMTCYNYGEPRYISTHCPKPKKASTGGKVFALTGTQTSSDDRLIRGICYINNTPLISIINTGATHSFIDADCVKRLGLVVSYMSGEIVIETPAKDFSIDLMFFPLENLDVTLGMNWLEINHVHINWYNKSLEFTAPGEEEEASFLSSRDLKEILEEEAQVFGLFAALSAKIQAVTDELQVVQDFPKVFLDDI
ncbi:uncharacterized protein LOC127096044 [Lathyrus oleraceus]|uniref:uncharacterized protein LOC127096041 n=1 Tax=Pisum sativum TaxID=3888 RepID=UPI0021D00587|nr:uncharacterized protein LOC127096041 [Pisum sativum]XP_050890626.1 uncharacterized protein LOC127096044 [Pisum sativum]